MLANYQVCKGKLEPTYVNWYMVVLQTVQGFMASQPHPNVPPQQYGLIKGLLTIGFPE